MEKWDTWMGDLPNIRNGLKNSYPTGEFGENTWWNDSNRKAFQPGRIGLAQWKTIVDQYIPREMSALYTTRGFAAAQVGVEEKYYNDYEKDLPPAQNAAELRQQYETINGYTDRTETMKDYLKQKAATRSIMRSVGVAGYGDYFTDKAYKNAPGKDWEMNMYDKDTMSLAGLLPHYDDDGVRIVPAWLNKGEQGIPDWMDLNDSRRKKETKQATIYSEFVEDHNFVDPNDVIEQFGKAHAMTDKERTQKEKQRVDDVMDVGDIEDQTKVDKIIASNRVREGTRKFRRFNVNDRYWAKRIKRRNNKVQTLQRIREMHEGILGEYAFHDVNEEAVYQDHPTDSQGNIVTYQMVLDWINSDKTAPEYELGEPSRAHFYKSLLEGVYSWAPKNIKIDEENLPDNYLKGQEDTFKHMLANLDPADRQRADRLHNEVHKPDTAAYIQKYHSDDTHLAHDQSGSVELSSDWDIAYAKNVNKVRFNGRTHS
jgi:hypothetical protein